MSQWKDAFTLSLHCESHNFSLNHDHSTNVKCLKSIFIEICSKGPNSQYTNISSWRQTGDNRLSEPMIAYFTDANMRHLADGSMFR